MNIIPVYNYSYVRNFNIKYGACAQTLSFEGAKINAASEKGMQKCEYLLRVIANKFSDIFEGKQLRQITKLISEIKPEANKNYLSQLENISRLYAANKCIDVNIEDKILEKAAQKGNSVIFIMNHSNQRKDPSMLAVLNGLLVGAYKTARKESEFPIPKIILNKDILTSMNKTKRKAFEAFGAVGVDANIYSADKRFNARVMLPVIRDFIKNKCNIFLFPEGKLAVKKNVDFEYRFQPGIAELINKILGIKKEITVIPVGFSYGKGKSKALNGMHIGEPVIFKRDNNDITTVTKGSILNSEFADDGFKKFFKRHKDETDIMITESGIPVKIKEITGYIKSLLSENLRICAKEAQKQISIMPENTEGILV